MKCEGTNATQLLYRPTYFPRFGNVFLFSRETGEKVVLPPAITHTQLKRRLLVYRVASPRSSLDKKIAPEVYAVSGMHRSLLYDRQNNETRGGPRVVKVV